MAIFMSDCPHIRNSRAFYNGCKTWYMFQDMTNNMPFSCVMAIFMSYCPRFWGSKAIYKFESNDQKLVIFVCYGCFHELLPTVLEFQSDLQVCELCPKTHHFAYYGRFHEIFPTVLGFQGNSHDPKTRYMFESNDQKFVVLAFYACFHELLSILLGFQGNLHVWELWPKTRCFRVLWPFSWAIAHGFGVPRRFTYLRVMTKNSSFSCFVAVFMSYCPKFWGSREI